MNQPNDVLLDTLQETLALGVVRHGVPGASMAVLHAGQVHAVAAGVLNAETGIAASPDSVFQIGSVTKSFTATLAMMLIEEGRLALGDLVVDHLPDFTLANGGADAARTIRVKHLLCHVSGIDGDRIEDTGNGDDAVEKFIANLHDCQLLHPVGAFFSYSNVGYNVLGRILEVIEGKPWDRILRERLLLPLGLSSAVTSAGESMAERTAVGHDSDAQGNLRPSTFGFAPKSNGPSGTMLAMSATDLLRFARFHMDGSVNNAEDGRRLLTPASLQLMRQAHVDIPQSYRYSGWGLGWMLFDWNGQGAFGHDGGWAGLSAYLRICPRTKLIAVLLANGGDAALLMRDAVGPILARYGELTPPELPHIDLPHPADLDLYAGRYSRYGQTITLGVDGSRLVGRMAGPYVDDVDGEEQGTPLSLELIDNDRAVCQIGGVPVPVGAYFLDFGPDGRPAYLHVTARAFRREVQGVPT
ncbi:MAG: serine hydrolase domain-containing protein [Sterolibacterium sp.]|jgi:CubicO group peptidase (beta-lactamase class C family)